MESCKLPDVPLFRGLTETEAAAAIEALRMRRRPFAKGEVLLEAGCTAPPLGVVLAGVLLPAKTWGWPSAACTRLPRRYAGASRRIFQCWRGAAAVCSSTCPLTVSSWPTTWALTAAP